MSIANREKSARAAKRRYHNVITKTLVSAAIVLGFGVVGAASAGAEPNTAGTGPNPYGTLSCHCQETAPAGSPLVLQEIQRGLREGHTAVLPGLPAPAQPGQPLP